MRPETEEWFRQAEYDLGTAQAMFKARRYVYAVFMCHLAVEKGLKAVVAERTEAVPPRIHNLVRLAKLARANLGEEQMEFISVLNAAAVGTRYPEFLDKAVKQYPKKVASEYLEKAREVIKCLKKEVAEAVQPE